MIPNQSLMVCYILKKGLSDKKSFPPVKETMESILHHIKNIESLAYPKALQGFQELTGVPDLLSYANAVSKDDLLILSGPDWYFIATISTREIIDLASINGMTFKDLVTVKELITSTFRGKEIHFEAMESTSYRFIKKMGGKVIKDTPILKKGIPFHKITIKL